MLKVYVRKSVFGNGEKIVKESFAKLKAEVISILRKKDSEEVKKALEYFEKDEHKYTHLEKSVDGGWIEKAGYGVGTVRIWKGKKYKKVAQGKWVRVFDREDRGAKSSMTRLIHKAESCKTAEELYQFCMSNHALFQDENGVDLPIMDKLRATIDIQKENLSKESNPYNYGVGENVLKEKQKNFDEKDKISKKEADLHKISRNLSQLPIGELHKEQEKLQRLVDNKTRSRRESLNNLIHSDTYKKQLDAINKELEKRESSKLKESGKNTNNSADKNSGNKEHTITTNMGYKTTESELKQMIARKEEELKEDEMVYKDMLKEKGESSKYTKNAKNNLETDKKDLQRWNNWLEAMKDGDIKESDFDADGNKKESEKITKEDFNKLVDKYLKSEREVINNPKMQIYYNDFSEKTREELINDNLDFLNNHPKGNPELQAKGIARQLLMAERYENEHKNESVKETYWIKDKGNNRITSEDAKNRIKSNLSQLDAYNNLIENSDKADAIKWNSRKNQLEDDNKYLMDRLNPDDRKEMESEQEKHQNRSDAMKGNQNAKKYGASMDDKEPIAKATKVADGKVTIPNDPAVKNQMKQLIASRYTDYVGNTSYGDMLSEVYYDGENLVSTDAKVLKVIKIGKLDGIEPNKYVKIDISGKDNISINQMDKKVGQYPNYKRVIPNGNDQTFAIDNKLAKEKIEAMKRDGSILKKDGKIALEFDGDAIKLDGTVIGKTYGTKLVGNDYIAIQADYILNVLGKNGEETNFNASENPQKALSVTTNVSTDVIMPMVAEKPDYEQNRKDFKEKQEFESERKAEAEKVKSEQDSRRIKEETKKELIGNRPDGIDADEYSSMIDFADDFYVKLGYDNSGERAYGMIKRMVDNAINQVNSKDYDFEEVLLNSDNKVSRKIFEMLTGERVGSNKQTAKKAWENWVGQEAVDAHNKKIADAEKAEKDKQAAEQKVKDDAEREQYHGFMDGKTPAGKGKAKDVLGKKANFNGKVMSWQELADKYIAEGGHASASTYVTNGGKEKPYYSISNKDGLGYEVPKTVYDYAMHISNGVKKSIADIIMLDEYEHEDFDDDYLDYDATQPDLFNSNAYKVGAALDSIFTCC